MGFPSIASLATALALTASANLFAQEGLPVAPGDRVRVAAPGNLWPRVCTVLALKDDTLVLDLGSRFPPIKSRLADVEQLEVSQGRKSRFGKGLAIGFLAGATAGAFAGLASDDDFFPAGVRAGVGAAVFGGLGLLIGGVIGSANPSEQWQEVPLDHLRVSLTPQGRDGLTLAVSLRL